MKKLTTTIITLLVMSITLSSCVAAGDSLTNMKSSAVGLSMVVKTYDEDANVIDNISGKSVSIKENSSFNITDSEDNVVSKSPVISLTIGGKSMYHVGSSLIAYDGALTDYHGELDTNVEFKNSDLSLPFLSRFKNSFQEDISGKSMLILIRSQSGTPLATFVGNKVRIDSTSIDKSTSIYIDGMRLFVYRCDYTIYEMDLID